MDDPPSREEMHASLEALEARTDAKFARLIGEMHDGFAALNGRIDVLNAKIDGKIDMLNAKIDGKIDGMAAVLGVRIDALSARIDAVERSIAGMKATVILTGLGAVAVVIGVLAYGQTWFGIGATTRDIVKAAVAEYVQQSGAHPK
jgi:hypothetical protein